MNIAGSPELDDSWWSRKCGGREVLQIAIPLVISTMSYTVMQFCDRLFLSWHNSLDLAAVVPSGVLSWTVMSLPLGVTMYATTFVAQYFGAKASERIGAVIWQTIWIGLATMPLFLLVGWFGESFFVAVKHSDELVWRETKYFWILAFGSAPAVVNAGLGAFWTGRGDTMTVMYVNMFGAALNIVLDYPMIFGVALPFGLSIPEQGIGGAALATTISIWVTMAVFMGLFLQQKYQAEFGTLSNWRLDLGILKRILRYGLPNGFQYLIEGGAITVFVLIIAQISDRASAATALAFSINMIVFVPVFGLSFAISTLVGQQIGEGEPELAERATWTGLWIGIAYSTIFAVLYLIVPGLFVSLHEVGSHDFEDISVLSKQLLAVVAAYCIFDTVQIVFVAAIKGAGDTRFVVFVTITCSSIFLVAGFTTTAFLSTPEAKLWCWWICLTGWIILLSCVYFSRFSQGQWKNMKVIEPELI